MKSKKDLILETNKNAKIAKIVDGEKQRIKFAIGQGKNVSESFRESSGEKGSRQVVSDTRRINSREKPTGSLKNWVM